MRARAAAKLRMWRPTAEQVEWDNPQILEIQKKTHETDERGNRGKLRQHGAKTGRRGYRNAKKIL